MPKFMGRVLFGLILFSYLWLSADICVAQYSGSIQGVLTDSSGAAIADARIDLRNLDTGIERTTKTSNSGNYSFPSLAPGHYVVRAEAKGLQTKEVTLTLDTAESKGVDISLAVATVSQTTTVVSEQAQPIDPDDSRIQATLQANTVLALPQLNRNLWDTLSVGRPESWERARVERERLLAEARTTLARKLHKLAPMDGATRGMWCSWTE